MGSVSRNCVKAIIGAPCAPVSMTGTGRPAIGPIESHMRGASSAKDQMRRTRTASAAASASASGAVAAAVLPRPAKPFSLAP